MDPDRAAEIAEAFAACDLAVCAVDREPAKFFFNDLCLRFRKAWTLGEVLSGGIGGWLHLFGNLLFLYVFGNNVEDRLGRVRYLAFYIGCGYAATYGFSLLFAGSDQPLVGASGAIAGVLGAYLVLFPRARVWSLLTFFFFIPVRLPAWLVLGSWFVLQYLYARGAGLSEASGTAYLAHVIGFVVGAALVWRLRGRTRQPPIVAR